ncbi:hypothetical protein J437_LFUL006561 [Ladona fulva]|uniref:Uncharacterized protein n=1 Tax=Ladona fulva TaxID=123851 RepID=A0A8K0KHK4_LADFU|nr:hypothetical protein J437_LFUL006561 [Ladona fulva]
MNPNTVQSGVEASKDESDLHFVIYVGAMSEDCWCQYECVCGVGDVREKSGEFAPTRCLLICFHKDLKLFWWMQCKKDSHVSNQVRSDDIAVANVLKTDSVSIYTSQIPTRGTSEAALTMSLSTSATAMSPDLTWLET